MGRPVFALRVQAEPGVHIIRSLRAWLKVGLRVFGLRCISIEEVTQENKAMVDVRKYTTGFIRPEDLHDGSRQERIINVYISEKHDVPVLEFESGDQLLAWASIGRVLARAYGFETDDWRGHVVELSLGHYTDKKDGTEKETIVLKTITSRDGSANGGPQRTDPTKLPAPLSPKDDIDDSIPF
jgi:hypothetical protein